MKSLTSCVTDVWWLQRGLDRAIPRRQTKDTQSIKNCQSSVFIRNIGVVHQKGVHPVNRPQKTENISIHIVEYASNQNGHCLLCTTGHSSDRATVQFSKCKHWFHISCVTLGLNPSKKEVCITALNAIARFLNLKTEESAGSIENCAAKSSCTRFSVEINLLTVRGPNAESTYHVRSSW